MPAVAAAAAAAAPQTFAERGPEGTGGGDDDLVSNMRRRRNMLADLIAAKDVQESLPPGSLGVLAPERDMSFEEKRKLSAHMASLPGEKLAAVLDIIEEHEARRPRRAAPRRAAPRRAALLPAAAVRAPRPPPPTAGAAG